MIYFLNISCCKIYLYNYRPNYIANKNKNRVDARRGVMFLLAQAPFELV
jgi:hypothetical protein